MTAYKVSIAGQTAVGRSVAISRSNCTDASMQTPRVKYTNSLATEKISDWPKSGPVKTGPT